MKKKVPDEWQARQAKPAILQVSSSRHNAKKITTRERGPFHQSITAILTEEKREEKQFTKPTHVAVYLFFFLGGGGDSVSLALPRKKKTKAKNTNETRRPSLRPPWGGFPDRQVLRPPELASRALQLCQRTYRPKSNAPCRSRSPTMASALCPL